MSRARFQEGRLIIRGKTPCYYVSFRVYDTEGKSIRKTERIGLVSKIGKREVNKLKADIVTKATQQLPTVLTGNRGDLCFKDFYEKRFLVLKVDWSDAHREGFRYIMDSFVLPKFGSLPLNEIDKVMVQSRLNSLSPQYSQSTIKHVRTKMVEVFEEAVEQEFISRNPASKTKIPSSAREPDTPLLSEAQLIQLIDLISDPRDKALFMVGTFCAMRTSEVFGLPWKNFDEDNGIFVVNQIAYRGKQYKRTKTQASKGTVPIGRQTLEAILAWRTVCKDTSSDALMFPSTNRNGRSKAGAPLFPGTWLQKRLQPIAEAIGIPFKVNFRATRRTASSLVQEHGAALATASGLLRHASTRTTGDFYSKEVPESVRRAVNSYEDRVFAARQTPKTLKRIK